LPLLPDPGGPVAGYNPLQRPRRVVSEQELVALKEALATAKEQLVVRLNELTDKVSSPR
jgi:hypothetical protein